MCLTCFFFLKFGARKRFESVVQSDSPHETFLFIGAGLVILGCSIADQTDIVRRSAGHDVTPRRRRRPPFVQRPHVFVFDGAAALRVRFGAQLADPPSETPQQEDGHQQKDPAGDRQSDHHRRRVEGRAAAQLVVGERQQRPAVDALRSGAQDVHGIGCHLQHFRRLALRSLLLCRD